MRRSVVRVVGVVVLCAALASLLSGCGGPDTEDQTLAEARRTLDDAGVPENITVTGAEAEGGDPDELIVCDQEPNAASPEGTVNLQVATVCPREDDEDDSRKKRRSGGRRGR